MRGGMHGSGACVARGMYARGVAGDACFGGGGMCGGGGGGGHAHKRDSHLRERYASYWNAFLFFNLSFTHMCGLELIKVFHELDCIPVGCVLPAH